MPKRTDISSIAIIGAGPIVIGQACEFDYSGVQACKALRQEGYRVILVNSNPATIMTDPELADATYIEPVTPEIVARILERERPDALLSTMGGQTALNTAMALADDGTLARLGIEMIGANRDAIARAEDRQLFRETMETIGLECPRSHVIKSLDDGFAVLGEIGLPAIIRPSFTLGGTGGGIAYNREQFQHIVSSGIAASPVGEVLVEESVLGWKEYEMEVVRDRADNCIIICSIENIDPMGVHTGDSMTVAPALTLTDKEYQHMRTASIEVLRAIGVETGGSNVQFAVDPNTGRMVVIEMNPRVSRSSALASKATGFPIAKIAAKLAVGYTLDELANDITRVTPASFEPSIDYVVVKTPRFAFEKFKGADDTLTTAMKSVGEAMSIGRNFPEALQKALRSLETGLAGLDAPDGLDLNDMDSIRAAVGRPTPMRLLAIAAALRAGLSIDEVFELCHVDRWFLRHMAALIAQEQAITAKGLPDTAAGWWALKRQGFADARLDTLSGAAAGTAAAARRAVGVLPVYKRIDTCAGEFPSETAYLYGCYDRPVFGPAACEARPTEREKVAILGGGPNRIGQGIEFDYCCVHAAFALREAGYETIMVNCNPETVSTDYDTSDRLYFEPLTDEDVVELCRKEASAGTLKGVIVQFGGQTPLKLAAALQQADIPILGTSPDAIDLAEDRERFQRLLHQLDLRQPANGIARSVDEAASIAEGIGYPVVIRPSYVLGGRAMEIVQDSGSLATYMREAAPLLAGGPVLLDQYLRNAIEVDVDAVGDGRRVHVAAIMEHIEEAGIHSGDSACSLPPFSLPPAVLTEIRRQTEALGQALGVVGLMNVQFAITGVDEGKSEIFVLEVNPRASRTVPFVAKAIGAPIAKIAARIMAGERLDDFTLPTQDPDYIAVKEAVFPFRRFAGVDVLLGPEMRSTGEVMGLDRDFGRAFAKAQLGAGVRLPLSGRVFVSVRDDDKGVIVPICRALTDMGLELVATRGTAAKLSEAGLPVAVIKKFFEGQPNAVDAMIDGTIDLVINTSAGTRATQDSYSLRRTALMRDIPYFTTIAGARAAAEAIKATKNATDATGGLEVRPLQDYLKQI